MLLCKSMHTQSEKLIAHVSEWIAIVRVADRELGEVEGLQFDNHMHSYISRETTQYNQSSQWWVNYCWICCEGNGLWAGKTTAIATWNWSTKQKINTINSRQARENHKQQHSTHKINKAVAQRQCKLTLIILYQFSTISSNGTIAIQWRVFATSRIMKPASSNYFGAVLVVGDNILVLISQLFGDGFISTTVATVSAHA